VADDADRAQALVETLTEAAVRAAARPIPAGVPGDCEDCGDHSQRLVGGRCAPCREPARKPRRW
jgi:hypothetical protein